MSALVRCSVAIYFLSLVLTVAGHGWVHTVAINGKSYDGWNPFNDPYLVPNPSRIVRKVLNDGFVASTDPDLPCHHGGKDGTSILADAPAGSQVTFQWSYWPADHQGPVSTYMASCNGDCTKFSTDSAKWFKIDASGYDVESKQWAADMLRANNNSWVSTIPSELAPGQYLMRNEIVALHSAEPQFYPSCSQIMVTGAGTGQPSEEDFVSIPGLYSGVTFPNIYSNFGSFTIPGPPPVTFQASNEEGPSGLPSTATSATPVSTTGTYVDQQPPNTLAATPISNRQPSDHCLLASRRFTRRTSSMKRH